MHGRPLSVVKQRTVVGAFVELNLEGSAVQTNVGESTDTTILAGLPWFFHIATTCPHATCGT